MHMPNRLPDLDLSSATPDQKRVLNAILSGPRGNLNGPFLSWIHSPAFAEKAQQLGAFCRFETGLPLRLSELAILVTAAHWRSQAEWFIHHPIALKAGIREEEAEAIRAMKAPLFDGVDDALIYDFATEILQKQRISDDTFNRCVTRFGIEITVNLVGLLGYYSLVAMTLNAFEVRADGQTELPFEQA